MWLLTPLRKKQKLAMLFFRQNTRVLDFIPRLIIEKEQYFCPKKQKNFIKNRPLMWPCYKHLFFPMTLFFRKHFLTSTILFADQIRWETKFFFLVMRLI